MAQPVHSRRSMREPRTGQRAITLSGRSPCLAVLSAEPQTRTQDFRNDVGGQRAPTSLPLLRQHYDVREVSRNITGQACKSEVKPMLGNRGLTSVPVRRINARTTLRQTCFASSALRSASEHNHTEMGVPGDGGATCVPRALSMIAFMRRPLQPIRTRQSQWRVVPPAVPRAYPYACVELELSPASRHTSGQRKLRSTTISCHCRRSC